MIGSEVFGKKLVDDISFTNPPLKKTELPEADGVVLPGRHGAGAVIVERPDGAPGAGEVVLEAARRRPQQLDVVPSRAAVDLCGENRARD